MKTLLIPFFAIVTCSLFAQDKNLPYYQIEDEPEAYTGGAVASRMIDGLGFRFYWATEGLRSQDLDYKPGPDARSTLETIGHIHEMSVMILNSVTKKVNLAETKIPAMPFEKLRAETLQNLKKASTILKNASEKKMKEFKLMFKGGDQYLEFSFWSQINGPIADCIWHVGQIVSFRRASGNPFTEKISLLTGKVIAK